MPEYQPVPVDAARQIAQQYAKNQVTILTWDAAHNLVHTTTYGVSVQDKEQAAFLGDEIATFVGCDLSQKRPHEDFRAVKEADWAVQKDLLLKALREAHWALSGKEYDPERYAQATKLCETTLTRVAHPKQ